MHKHARKCWVTLHPWEVPEGGCTRNRAANATEAQTAWSLLTRTKQASQAYHGATAKSTRYIKRMLSPQPKGADIIQECRSGIALNTLREFTQTCVMQILYFPFIAGCSRIGPGNRLKICRSSSPCGFESHHPDHLIIIRGHLWNILENIKDWKM